MLRPVVSSPRPALPSRPARRTPPRGGQRWRLALLGSTALLFAALPATASTALGKAPESTVLLRGSEQFETQLPTRVAAGSGHVIAMQGPQRTAKRTSDGPSRIYALAAGQAPRLIATVKGGLAWPTVGTDVRGRAVVVVSPCLDSATPLPDCNLSAIDVETGRATVVPRSKGAYIGDLDHGRGIVARRSPSVGVRVALLPPPSGGKSRPMPFGTVLAPASRDGYPAATRFVDSLDLSGTTIAATVLWGMPNGGDGGGSLLLRGSTTTNRWNELAHSGYGGASGILRVYRGATVTPTGIRALYDGGDNAETFVARYSATGKVVRDRTLDLSILASAAFDGDRVVTNGAVILSCEDTMGDLGCAVASTGPLGLG